MIVHFPKGHDAIFSAGSCEWIANLLRNGVRGEKVIVDVLDQYLKR